VIAAIWRQSRKVTSRLFGSLVTVWWRYRWLPAWSMDELAIQRWIFIKQDLAFIKYANLKSGIWDLSQSKVSRKPHVHHGCVRPLKIFAVCWPHTATLLSARFTSRDLNESLPGSIRYFNSSQTFKSRFKTHLFYSPTMRINSWDTIPRVYGWFLLHIGALKFILACLLTYLLYDDWLHTKDSFDRLLVIEKWLFNPRW